MGIARKITGLSCTYPNKKYYHCLEVSTSGSELTLKVVHNSGAVVTTISTESEYIRKHIHMPLSVNTYKILGGILGRRLNNFGITSLTFQTFTPTERSKPKIQTLIEAMESEGVKLEEVRPINLKNWPIPMNMKKRKYMPQPNTQFDMLGSKNEHPYFKRLQMFRAIRNRNKMYGIEEGLDKSQEKWNAPGGKPRRRKKSMDN